MKLRRSTRVISSSADDGCDTLEGLRQQRGKGSGVLTLPDSLPELENLASELSELMDACGVGAIDVSSPLERLIVGLLDDVETEIQEHLRTADAPSSRELTFLQKQSAGATIQPASPGS